MRGYNFSIPGARQNIEKGIKVLTMRKDRKDGWLPKVGEEIKLTDGRRWVKAGEPGSIQPILIDGKNPVCTWVGPVWIGMDCKYEKRYYIETEFLKDIKHRGIDNEKIMHGVKITINNQRSSISVGLLLQEFARMDGWSNPAEMFQFFKDHYGLPVKLNLIYWGPR